MARTFRLWLLGFDFDVWELERRFFVSSGQGNIDLLLMRGIM